MIKGTTLLIRARTGSSRNKILVLDFESEPLRITIAVTAHPIAGQANEAIVKLLAERLGIARGKVEVIKGEHSRVKTIAITGLTHVEVLERLTEES